MQESFEKFIRQFWKLFVRLQFCQWKVYKLSTHSELLVAEKFQTVRAGFAAEKLFVAERVEKISLHSEKLFVRVSNFPTSSRKK
jgi:hypothetical protein